METLRPASILPAIKCSTCGAEIEISSMGEHICDSSQEKPADDMTASAWERKPIGQSYVPAVQEPPSDSARITSIASDSSKSLRPLRTAPPRIDAAAASRCLSNICVKQLLTWFRQALCAKRSSHSQHQYWTIRSISSHSSQRQQTRQVAANTKHDEPCT